MNFIAMISLGFIAIIMSACGNPEPHDATSSTPIKTVEITQKPQIVSLQQPAPISEPQIQFNNNGDAFLAWIPLDQAPISKLVFRVFRQETQSWGPEQFVMLPKQVDGFHLQGNATSFAIVNDELTFIKIFSLANNEWQYERELSTTVTSSQNGVKGRAHAQIKQNKILQFNADQRRLAWPVAKSNSPLNKKVEKSWFVAHEQAYYFVHQARVQQFDGAQWAEHIELQLNTVSRDINGDYGVEDSYLLSESDYYYAPYLISTEAGLFISALQLDESQALLKSFLFQPQQKQVITLPDYSADSMDQLMSFRIASSNNTLGVLWVGEKGNQTHYGLAICAEINIATCEWQTVVEVKPIAGVSKTIGYYEFLSFHKGFLLANNAMSPALSYFGKNEDGWQQEAIELPGNHEIVNRIQTDEDVIWLVAECRSKYVANSNAANDATQCAEARLLTYSFEDQGFALEYESFVEVPSRLQNLSLAIEPSTKRGILLASQKTSTESSESLLFSTINADAYTAQKSQDKQDLLASQNPELYEFGSNNYFLIWQHATSNGVTSYVKPYIDNQWQEVFTIPTSQSQLTYASNQERAMFAWSSFNNIKYLVYENNAPSTVKSVDTGLNVLHNITLRASQTRFQLAISGRDATQNMLAIAALEGDQWQAWDTVATPLNTINKLWLLVDEQTSTVFWQTNSTSEQTIFFSFWDEQWTTAETLLSSEFIKNACMTSYEDYYLVQWSEYPINSDNADPDATLISYAWVIDRENLSLSKPLELGTGDYQLQCLYNNPAPESLLMTAVHNQKVVEHHFDLTTGQWSNSKTLYQIDNTSSILFVKLYQQASRRFLLYQALNIQSTENQLYLVNLSNVDSLIEYNLSTNKSTLPLRLEPSMLIDENFNGYIAWLASNDSDERNASIPQAVLLELNLSNPPN